MSFLGSNRFVVALDIAGTAHLVVEAADAVTAVATAFEKVRRHDIQDWWPRRQATDYIAPHATPYQTMGRAYEVGLPILGTAYVTVEAADIDGAVAAAFAQVVEDDIDDWRPIRAPEDLHAPSVALEADTEE